MMLQPIPARPFFRVLELPLSLVMIGVSGLFLFAAFQFFTDATLLAVAFLLSGIGVGALGGVALIHAVTGRFPAWVAGDGREEDNPGAAAVERE
jgi:hypothetical protein